MHINDFPAYRSDYGKGWLFCPACSANLFIRTQPDEGMVGVSRDELDEMIDSGHHYRPLHCTDCADSLEEEVADPYAHADIPTNPQHNPYR
jgi:hypothetical protein